MALSTGRTPWHLWLVIVVGVLWNGFGAFDFVMTFAQGETYLRAAGMTDAQIAYFHAMPVWMTGIWALGVWGSVIGTVLLITRSRWAQGAFAASLVGATVALIYGFLSDGMAANGVQGVVMSVVIVAGCVFFLWYASLMVKRGVLR